MEITVCPSTLQEGFSSYSPTALKALFDGQAISHILDMQNPNSAGFNYAQDIGRISLSGVQPKFSITIKENRLAVPSDGEKGKYILKPAPLSYSLFEREYCPANEHLTMQLAEQVYNIETASNALCFFKNGEAAYLCRRFDIGPNEIKYQQEDFASLGGFTKANGGSNFKYANLSYQECADIIRKYTKAAPIEILKFFRLILFNYLTLNDDAHLKNFSLINRGDGEYHLSPAYDLINTAIHLSKPQIFALEKGLFKEGMKITDTKTIGRSHFEEFGKRIGLSERIVSKEINLFAAEHPQVQKLIQNSFLSARLKKLYYQQYNYRRHTLIAD